MERILVLLFAAAMCACASSPEREPASKESSPFWTPSKEPARQQDLQVFYGEPRVRYKKVCKIEAEGSNALEQKYTKKADFEGQFKRRARRCKGANAVIIDNMFAFENGSAFADGAAIVIEP